VRGYIEKAGGKGLTGVVQEVFDLNLPGFIEETDKRMGTIVMHLTEAGETEGVETAVRFRNHAVVRLKEMMKMADISQGYDSENPEGLKLTVKNMEFLEAREPEPRAPVTASPSSGWRKYGPSSRAAVWVLTG